jgi:hypothetical protein
VSVLTHPKDLQAPSTTALIPGSLLSLEASTMEVMGMRMVMRAKMEMDPGMVPKTEVNLPQPKTYETKVAPIIKVVSRQSNRLIH